MPERASGASTVAPVDVPNLAVGDTRDACVVKRLLLSIDDAFYIRQSRLAEAAPVPAGSTLRGQVATDLVNVAPGHLGDASSGR